MSNNTIWVGIGGLVVGLLIGWGIGHGTATKGTVSLDSGTDQNSMMEATDTSATTNMVDRSGATDNMNSGSMGGAAMSEESQSSIVVTDQGAGSVVSVASVQTDVPAWVAVREIKNGALGNVLGAWPVQAGASKNVVVKLRRATVAGQTYKVVLFKENGDNLFDLKTDAPLTSNGVLISGSFKTVLQ